MIVLDTNVISEISKQQGADERVQSWFATIAARNVGTTAVTVGEIRAGIERLPEGRRKFALKQDLDGLLRDVLAGRVLSYDVFAANHYGLITSKRYGMGRPIGIPDAQIAAICYANQAILATRNIKDFEETGVQLINPWDE